MGYKRVLLKISGEALMGTKEYGVDHGAATDLAKNIYALQKTGIEIGIVLGGGNIFRGIQQGPLLGLERTPADQIGMLATLINAITLEQALRQLGAEARIMTALDCPKVAESYQWDTAMRYLANGHIVLFAGGTGHPYFTTDTCAALRASEIHAHILLKSTTHVDGIYSKDPRKFSDAHMYPKITYEQVLSEQLGILDLTAVTICMESQIPIRVYNLYKGSFLEALEGKIGSIVSGGQEDGSD